jgi:hypothetical protein
MSEDNEVKIVEDPLTKEERSMLMNLCMKMMQSAKSTRVGYVVNTKNEKYVLTIQLDVYVNEENADVNENTYVNKNTHVNENNNDVI